MAGKHVVVAGAGVIGLTAAVDLLESFPGLQCTVVADWIPGDAKIVDYASAYAGAHHVSHARADDEAQIALDRYTLDVLIKEEKEKVTDSLMWIDQYEYYTEDADAASDPEALVKIGMPEFRRLTSDELLPETAQGFTFKTLTIDTQPYLVYLLRRFTRLGGRVIRAKLKALGDALSLPELLKPRPSIIVNCSGLGNLFFTDVADTEMYPVRGQLCLIRAPWLKHGRGVSGKGKTSYTIPRSSGIVIVGGTRAINNWDTTPDPQITETILKSALYYDRDLLPPEKRSHGTYKDIDLVEVAVGRRPGRRSGIRFEVDEHCVAGTIVLHNYGHAGFGWQSSWGFARKSVEALREYLQ